MVSPDVAQMSFSVLCMDQRFVTALHPQGSVPSEKRPYLAVVDLCPEGSGPPRSEEKGLWGQTSQEGSPLALCSLGAQSMPPLFGARLLLGSRAG